MGENLNFLACIDLKMKILADVFFNFSGGCDVFNDIFRRIQVRLLYFESITPNLEGQKIVILG